MPGPRSRSAASKFMLACLGIAVIMVLWSAHSSLQRSRQRRESPRLFETVLGTQPVKIPAPAGTLRVPKLPAAQPGFAVRVLFHDLRTAETSFSFAFSEAESISAQVLAPEDFPGLRESILGFIGDTEIAEGAPPRRTGRTQRRILEDTDEFLTVEASGNTAAGGSADTVIAESFGLLRGRLFRLTVTASAKTAGEPPDPLPRLTAWREAIYAANQEGDASKAEKFSAE